MTKQLYELIDQGYSIDRINEADRLGPTYAIHVGYQPNGLETFLTNANKRMTKYKRFGKNELSQDVLEHRISLSPVTAKSLAELELSKFPKAQDEFKAMLKKIKPKKSDGR